MVCIQMFTESLEKGVHVMCNGGMACWCLLCIAFDEFTEHSKDAGMRLLHGFKGGREALDVDFSRAWNVGVVFCKISSSYKNSSLNSLPMYPYIELPHKNEIFHF